MIDSYPDEFLRGIPNASENFITPEGYPTQAVFNFDEYNKERIDGFCELSINWLDDEGAIQVLMNQINPRKNTFQFQGGYCRLTRFELHSLRDYFSNGHLSYERRPIEDNGINGPNKYHGNILMKNDLSGQAKVNIRVALAVLAGTVIPRSDK